MQIKHLSGANLQSFGRILPNSPENTDGYIHKSMTMAPAPQIACYETAEETILDYVSGMSVLVIYRNEQAELFYLDRVLALQPGTKFSILPLDGTCCVDLLTVEKELQPVAYTPASALENANKGLQLERVYTFLYQEFSPNFYFRGEQHKPYELVYVKRGTMHNIVRGQDIVLNPQSFMIIDSNDWHTQYSDLAVSFLTVSFWALDSSMSYIVNQAFPMTPQVSEYFERMLLQHQQDAYCDDYIEALLKLLLIDLLQKKKEETASKRVTANHFENQIVDQAIRIISESSAKKLTLEELAAQVHISVPYLYKLFQVHLGISPGKYIAKIRVEECKVLLRDGQLPMGQIAERMGFSSLQHFSRQFKSICGISPTQYLRSLR